MAYADGMAYMASCSTHGPGFNKIFAIDTATGTVVWNRTIGPGYVGPVIDGDTIYIGNYSHETDPLNEYIYALNRFTGTLKWKKNIPGGIPESILYNDTHLFFASDKAYCLDKQTGQTVWNYDLGSLSLTKPILKDRAFFTASSQGRMVKLDIKTGQPVWKKTLAAGPWDNSITADGKGRLFLAIAGNNTLNAYDEQTGARLWSFALEARPLSFNAFHNKVVFISDTKGWVYAVHSTSGILKWKTKIGGKTDISSPTLAGGLVFIGTRDGENGSFFALDETTGRILWKYKIGASVTAPPSIADGMLFGVTDNWHMYAFDIGIGEGNWLLHRYDRLNTAFTPRGLIKWQYVKADCKIFEKGHICTITNLYDYTVKKVELKLQTPVNWFDDNGKQIAAKTDCLIIPRIKSLGSKTVFIRN
ncbi:MAG: PQQ-binding-like beta-propeller repeat protein [Candidatus Omnitrophica bacterium]|nr:PQQ-binding-like beta-propeller repeat protein [Candidatus Omnitrophota bacterium]